jgi:hypothetical protein
MHVAVDQARYHPPSLQVDHCAAGTGQLAHLLVAAKGYDPAPCCRQRGGLAARGRPGAGPDAAAQENSLGNAAVNRHGFPLAEYGGLAQAYRN